METTMFLMDAPRDPDQKLLGFRLELDGNGGVSLLAYEDGDNEMNWEIATITREGTLSLASCIGDNIGLQVDKHGRIKVTQGT
jgi:hypothetical protein